MNNSSSVHHLLWRAGFGPAPNEWATRREWTITRTVDQLFPSAPPELLPEPAITADYRKGKMTGKQRAEDNKKQRQFVAGMGHDWINRMADPAADALLEKMCLFWHGHFACTVRHGVLATRYLNTLRTHALGNFRDLLRAIARDPAMIRFLNNQQNRKASPNENFARELMELFTIGRGNYTETDVKEAARAFTGWSSNLRGEFIFRERQHDFGEKTFMGRTGPLDGDDVIDSILDRKETAVFLAARIFRFFVSTELNQEYITELADVLRASDYDIAVTMRHLFTSEWFYDPVHVGNRIKSPVELMAGLIRQLHITDLPVKGTVGIQRILGQLLFNPPNVAGWPGGRTWIDNSTLLTRLNLAGGILLAADLDLQLPDDLEGQNRQRLKRLEATIDLVPLRRLTEGSSPTEARRVLADYLLAPPDPGNGVTAEATPDLLILRLLSTPEYQLC